MDNLGVKILLTADISLGGGGGGGGDIRSLDYQNFSDG